MAKKNLSKRIFNSIFGKRFGWEDILFIALVLPYAYGVFLGYAPPSEANTILNGIIRIYWILVAPPLVFWTIGKILIQNIIKTVKK